ncbi:MAG TPA: SusC/RagA family TonB-linked outer membrane protein [Bacteroidales bacterium]|nr:SusC/RagA family TonB-linked outer membrane protein [Bacteroidales bacterium]
MRKLVFLLACLFWVGIGLVNAQSKSIAGKVVSGDDGQPVVGATIRVKGAAGGTITDAVGEFKLNIPSSAKTLVVSYIGMLTQELEARDNMIVTLQPDSKQVNEVVVIGTALGIKRQQREVGYAATTIKSNFITQANSVNVQQALNGKVSGLNITTVNSGVFEDAKINIRGIRSLTGNNQPMLVLDGAPVSLSYLYSIAPEDIQEITVLKSGASAALYGPDAVNGVIMVTTKKGDTDNTKVSLTSSMQMSSVAYFPKLQSIFGAGAGEVQDEFGNYGYVPYENQQYGPRYDGTMQDIGITLEDGSVLRGPYSNKYGSDKVKFWNTGYTFQNAVSLSSKDFFFSLSNADIRGLMPNDKNRRTTMRFNSGKQYNNLTLAYNVNYTNSQWDVVDESLMPDLTQSSYTGSILSQIMQVPGNVPLISVYGDKNSKWSKYENYFNEFAINPFWIIDNLRQKGTSHEMVGTFDATYTFAKWLKANLKASTNFTTSYTKSSMGAMSVSDWTLANRDNTSYHNQAGEVFTSQTTNSRMNLDYYLNGEYDATSDLTVKYVLGGSTRQTDYANVYVGGYNLTVPNLYNVSVRSGDAYVPAGTANATIQTRLLSAYGNLTFGYKKYLYLELTGRNDWDSRLLSKNRSVFYPAANVSAILSDILPELKEGDINYLKVRSAWSKSGNVNLAAYQLNPTFALGVGFPFGSNVGYTAGNTIPSLNLLPEYVETIEAGVELGLFEDRIHLDLSAYNQNNTNQILSVTQSWTTGYPTGLSNAASFRNYGAELEVNVTPLVKIGSGDLNLKFNASYNDNKVTSTLNDNPVVLSGNSNFIQNAASNPTINNIALVGQSAFAFQMTDYVRDPKTGKVIVDATTGNPALASEMVVKGRTMPKWIVGITPSYNIGHFNISMTWDFKTGHNFYAGQGADMDFAGISARSAQYGRERFVFPNSVYKSGKDESGNPIYSNNTNILVSDGNYGFWTGKTTNTGIATNYFASAAAWRLRELNVTYNLPKEMLKETKYLSAASISLVGKNLLMFVPSSNQWGDPEFNFSSSGNTMGISSTYQSPASRFFGATLNVQF